MRHPSLIALSHDHHHGLALALRCRKQALGQMKPTGAEGLRQRAEEFKSFFENDLARHFRAEEEILFPFIEAGVLESREIIAGLLDDHREMRRLASSIPPEDRLSKFLFDAGDLLERHIRREERELFPMIEKWAGADRLDDLKARIDSVLGRS